ncbi:hypothetical protein [Pseudophaeobacter flagellatus]|uniref:hypothetical protein n=1 Tax=Pseudophaeobacter flagellatus TaxID=2899119 RepID=UPI001E30324F|nr:hypothetical protein [Pseudophaeobacter flagellatus]MCD9147802.1 hypothetical protein [Pseudophaeobacter flagellatus]
MGIEQGLPLDEEQGALGGKEAELQAEIRELRGLLERAGRVGRSQSDRPAPKAMAQQLALPDVVRFPLAEFAEGRGQRVPLPESVEEIAEVIGRGDAVRLVEGTRASGKRRWRRSLYVPTDMTAEHRIASMIGLEAATRLSFSHGNCIVELPSCFALRKAYAADHASRLSDAGATQAEIANEMGVEQKTVKSLLDVASYWQQRLS